MSSPFNTQEGPQHLTTVSACLICKNEKSNIRQLLDDLCPVLEEVHVTDTGSTDGTLQIIQDMLVQYPNLYLHHFDWVNDFSAARNYSFSFADKTQWLLWLDCDDRIDSANLLKFKNEILVKEGVDVWQLPYIYGPTVTVTRERFVRRSLNPVWKCAIHEYLDTKDGRVERYEALQVVHNHVGKIREPGRNLRILAKEFEKNPDSSRIAYYYGKDLADAGQDKAKDVLEHYLNLKTWRFNDDEIGARFRLAKMFLRERDYTKAINTIEPVYHLEHKRNRAEYYFIFGEVERALQNLTVAISWYERCLCKMPEAGIIHKDYWTTLPLVNIALCYRDLGEWDKVYETIQRMVPYPECNGIAKELQSYRVHPKEDGQEVILEFGTSKFEHSYKVGAEPLLVNVGSYSKFKAPWVFDTRMPFLDASIDGVVIGETIIPLSELSRVLKPSGFLWSEYPIHDPHFILVEDGKYSKRGHKIAASFTTCRRPELFHKSYHSFKLRCMDVHLIDKIFIVDDFSPNVELQAMKRTAPDAVFLSKKTKGHASSVNTILREAINKGYDYLVYMEDDFYFIKDEELVTRTVSIMKKDPSIGQVLFNRNYAESDTEIERNTPISGDEIVENGKIIYTVHDWKPIHSPIWKKFHDALGKSSHAHWPHFSLIDGVWNLAAIKDVGFVDEEDNFEFKYAVRYSQKGYKTAFLPDINCIHLGRPREGVFKKNPEHFAEMRKRHNIRLDAPTDSAYNLNNTVR